MRASVRVLAIMVLAAMLAVFPGGCGTTRTTSVDNTHGSPTVYEDPGTVGKVAGVGFESQDLVSMTDQMVRDMLASPILNRPNRPARIIIDAEYFKNESSSRINKNIITDRLRVELNRAAAGRMTFVGREYSDMVAKEREMKREGSVDRATLDPAAKQFGADYRLGGRITSLDAVNQGSGMESRFHQITFEMVDLETGGLVWTGIYDFKKAAQDDVIYR